MTDVGYDGEIVQCVVTQKLATCIAYKYTYVDRSLRLFANIVAVHYGSYQKTNKYLYTQLSIGLSTCSTCTLLLITSNKSSIYSYTPHFLEYSVIYVL